MVVVVEAAALANQSLASPLQQAKISLQQSELVVSALCSQVARQQPEQARPLHEAAPISSQQMADLPAQRDPAQQLVLAVPQRWDLQAVQEEQA